MEEKKKMDTKHFIIWGIIPSLIISTACTFDEKLFKFFIMYFLIFITYKQFMRKE